MTFDNKKTCLVVVYVSCFQGVQMKDLEICLYQTQCRHSFVG